MERCPYFGGMYELVMTVSGALIGKVRVFCTNRVVHKRLLNCLSCPVTPRCVLWWIEAKECTPTIMQL